MRFAKLHYSEYLASQICIIALFILTKLVQTNNILLYRYALYLFDWLGKVEFKNVMQINYIQKVSVLDTNMMHLG